MEQKSGAQIGQKVFLQSLVTLFVLMMLAGLLTLTIPSGHYQRLALDGDTVIDPDSFEFTRRPDYPVWRWFTAPIEVLWRADNSPAIIMITVFILMVGAAFAVLDKAGILKAAIAGIVHIIGAQKYLLLLVISLSFMLLGAIFGIFEEVILLVPIMLGLSHSLSWDALIGLGMSILAVNLGFSTAITKSFTTGVAQQVAGLPTFSGTGLRLFIFLAVYIIFAIFITCYAKRTRKNQQSSQVHDYKDDLRRKYARNYGEKPTTRILGIKHARLWLTVFLVLILTVLFAGSFISTITDFTLPLVGILLLFASLGAGLLTGRGGKLIWQAIIEGVTGIAPGIPLILMATSIKYIADSGAVMDTILHSTSGSLSHVSPYMGSILICFLVLFVEIFIASSSAKAFLLMPILLPLADIIGVTRQFVITAHCFGAACLLLRGWLLQYGTPHQPHNIDRPRIVGFQLPQVGALDAAIGYGPF